MATQFETTSCSRCGGSGKYSYNQMDGDRCYGCGGTGVKLTKRGAKAKEFFLKSLETPVSEIKVGMKVFTTFGLQVARRWWSVTKAENGEITITSKKFGDHGLRGYEVMMAAQDMDEVETKLVAALVYQNSLKA